MEELVKDYRRITRNEIAKTLEFSYGTAQNIVHNEFVRYIKIERFATDIA